MSRGTAATRSGFSSVVSATSYPETPPSPCSASNRVSRDLRPGERKYGSACQSGPRTVRWARGVLVAGDHERGRRHLGEVHGREEGVILGHELGEGIAAPAGRGQQYTRLDPGFGQVHFRPVVRIGEPRAQQQARGVPAHRVPGHGDLAPVQAPGELRDGGLDRVELVEDARHVLGPRPPVQRRPGGRRDPGSASSSSGGWAGSRRSRAPPRSWRAGRSRSARRGGSRGPGRARGG